MFHDLEQGTFTFFQWEWITHLSFVSRLVRMQRLDTLEEIVALQYDSVENPTVVTDPDSQVTFTYDGLNRVLTAATADLGGQPTVTLTSV
ncbi:MAG: hypothetical protein NPIRA05_19910 [Nitrospirales bacterium]|nr:MAG: hypothetical protein NPIRA05_19910 [Nitrospirales bacterium]